MAEGLAEARAAAARAAREAVPEEATLASMRPIRSKPNRKYWQTRHCPTMHNG